MKPVLPPAILIEPNDGCLTMARALRRRGVSVYALANGASAYIGRSRAIRSTALPSLSSGHEPWLARLADFAGTAGVLISGSDAATEFLVRERPSIPSDLRSFESPTSAHLALMNKATLYQAARAAGVRCPWTIPVSRPEELLYAGATADYPCIIKPALSHVGKAVGNYRTRRIDSERELLSSVGAALEDGVAMLCTEYVPGGEENLEGAVTLRGADGRYLLEYGRRKLRQHPIDFGSGSLLCSAHVPETMALAKRLVESVDFVGISSFEAKLHAVTGERVLTEINVRVPLNFGLGDAAGVEASWRLYAGMAGLALEDQPRQRDDRKVVIPWLDARAVKTRFSRGELRLRGLLQSYKGTRSAGVLDPRDPAPGIAMAGRMLSERRNRSAPRSDSTEASSPVDGGRRRRHTATPAS